MTAPVTGAGWRLNLAPRRRARRFRSESGALRSESEALPVGERADTLRRVPERDAPPPSRPSRALTESGFWEFTLPNRRKAILSHMRWNSRFANRSFHPLPDGLGTALAQPRHAPKSPPGRRGAPIEAVKSSRPMEMSFMKGDTRNGSKVTSASSAIRCIYRETTYTPTPLPLESRKAHPALRPAAPGADGRDGGTSALPRLRLLLRPDMRFYMVETAAGKFYRSLPERSGKCYLDEPGIWSLFQDLDDLLALPPSPTTRNTPPPDSASGPCGRRVPPPCDFKPEKQEPRPKGSAGAIAQRWTTPMRGLETCSVARVLHKLNPPAIDGMSRDPQ